MALTSVTLSRELLDCVVDELVEMHHAAPEAYMFVISTLSRVHRGLHRRLQPVLFSHLVLRSPDLDNTEDLRTSPHLVLYVRHLSVSQVHDWSAIDQILLRGRESIHSMHIDDACDSLQRSALNLLPGYARSMSWLRQVSIILGTRALPSPDLWNPWHDHSLLNWLVGLHPGAWRQIRRFAIFGGPATHVPRMPKLEIAIVGLPGPVQLWDGEVLRRLMHGHPAPQRVVFVYCRARNSDTERPRSPDGLTDDAKRQVAAANRDTVFMDVRVDVANDAFLAWWRHEGKCGRLWKLEGRTWLCDTRPISAPNRAAERAPL